MLRKGLGVGFLGGVGRVVFRIGSGGRTVGRVGEGRWAKAETEGQR